MALSYCDQLILFRGLGGEEDDWCSSMLEVEVQG